MEELADGGLDWLIETGGLQSNPPFLRGGVRNSGGLDFEVEGGAGGSPKGAEMKW